MISKVKDTFKKHRREQREAQMMAHITAERHPEYSVVLAPHPETRTGVVLEKLGIDNRELLEEARERME